MSIGSAVVVAETNALKAVETALNSYIRNCRANGLAESTIGNYGQIIGSYVKFLNENGYAEASKGSVSEWKNSMMETGMKVTTLAFRMGVVKAFFDWAVDMDMLDSNPFVPAIMPSKKSVSKEKARPYEHILGSEDIEKILHTKRPYGAAKESWARNRAILITLLTTGLRNSELRDLTLDNLDFENSCIYVEHGKGDKYRVAAFPAVAQEAVKEYLTSGYRPNEELDADAPVFGMKESKYDTNWHKMDRAVLSQIVERNIRLITGKEGFRSHSCRHGYAEYLYQHSVHVDTISEMLGHSSVSTTEVYLNKCNKAARCEVVNNAFAM